MKIMNHWRQMLNQHYNLLKSLPPTIDKTKLHIYDKVSEVNKWYTKVTGLDKVQQCQQLVTDLQVNLLAVQEKRRSIGERLSEVRKKSNDLQEQIRNMKRFEEPERFINLMKEDTSILKEETELQKFFMDLDREERDTFTQYTNAVRDSHEKQRWQLEYTKYLGYTLSIIGSLLAYLYATIFRENLKHTLNKGINGTKESIDHVLTRLDEFDQDFYELRRNTNLIMERIDYGKQVTPKEENRMDAQVTLKHANLPAIHVDQSVVVRSIILGVVAYCCIKLFI